ncbi:MAG: hypothetical protein AMXMBFR58_34240 [Phycisphaerae bacterium]
MTRELKLSLILGFSLVLVVTVLISDYLSKARTTRLDGTSPTAPVAVVPPKPEDLLTRDQAEAAERELAVAGTQDAPVKTSFREPDAAATRDNGFKPVEIPMGKRDASTAGADPTAGQPGTDARAADRTHTIEEGDGLYALAKRYYGNGSLWEKLAVYNNIKPSAMLKVGATIKIPSKEVLTGKPEKDSVPPVPLNAGTGAPEDVTRLALGNGREIKPLISTDKPAPADSAADAAADKSKSYTVKKGDTLSQIAARQLGSSRRTGEILSLNKHQLQAPEDLQIGMVLKLPSK